mgnify:CR=1 FL=1
MTNSKHVPKRRFKEFESNGEWELLTLSDISEGFEYGLNVPAKEFDGVNKYLRITDIDDTSREFLISNLSSPDANCESLSNYLLAEGDILFARTGASTGKTYYYKETDGKVFFAGFLIRARVKGNFDHRFVFQNTLTKKYKNYIELTSQRSGQPGVNAQEYSRFSLNIPSLSEQKVIGDFVEKLDSLISKHQHKLDKLKDLKKAYLTEMFPAEGERVPKRRFPGFEGEWEQKRLTTIASMHARIGWQNLRTSEFLNDGDYYLITGTDFLDGRINFENCYYVDKERYQQDKNIQVKSGSILITKDGTIGKVAIVSHLDKPATLNAGVFNVVIKESNVDEKYLYQYLASPFLMDYVSKRVTGGTIKHLNQGILVDFPINIPVYEEQKAIGRFFEHLDQSITLQQQKLDKLNDLKKAYLNELFV